MQMGLSPIHPDKRTEIKNYKVCIPVGCVPPLVDVSGGVLHPGGVGRPPPPVNRMKHRCKNITLPQTSFMGGNKSFRSKNFVACEHSFTKYYRSGTLNSNMVNSKFHLIRSFFEIFARFLSFHV